jgi:hypothetical protein
MRVRVAASEKGIGSMNDWAAFATALLIVGL